MLLQERHVVGGQFDHCLGNATQQRQVAADVRLKVVGGDIGIEQQAAPIAGNAKLDHPQFTHGIDHNHLATTTTQMRQRSHQSRVIAGRVATDDQGQIALLQIVERDGGRAGTQRLIQSHTAGLMAVVAAVVDVVGAIQARSKLQQKARFVAAATAEVPKRFVGSQRLQMRFDALEGFVPGDRFKVCRPTRVQHWLNQATRGFQLSRRPLLQFGHDYGATRSRR